MKDLDYDELDRAVNSVITNAPEPIPDVANTMTSVSPSRTVARNSLDSSLAGRRSVGRFMDVVRPAPERPVGQVITPSAPHPDATVNLVTGEPVLPEVIKTMPIEEPASEKSWPDPIDFHESMNNQAIKTDVKNEDADLDQINDEITSELSQHPSESESPESPFITGTKVEKRPLGAFSDDLPVPVAKYEPPMNAEPVPKKTIDDGPNFHIDAPLPPELQDDLLAIESDSTTHPDIAYTNENTVTPDIGQPIIGGEIAQQYKEQPSSGDQKTGAIYDTNDYHKAPLQPVKKKSGWMWVVWIVLLLLVGAGTGAAVYFLVLK